MSDNQITLVEDGALSGLVKLNTLYVMNIQVMIKNRDTFQVAGKESSRHNGLGYRSANSCKNTVCQSLHIYSLTCNIGLCRFVFQPARLCCDFV
jgi:hypothetical protein